MFYLQKNQKFSDLRDKWFKSNESRLGKFTELHEKINIYIERESIDIEYRAYFIHDEVHSMKLI